MALEFLGVIMVTVIFHFRVVMNTHTETIYKNFLQELRKPEKYRKSLRYFLLRM